MRIRWTRLAIADLDNLFAYIAADDLGAALRTLQRVEEAVEVLSRHPEAGKAGRIRGTREMVVSGTPYIVPYRVRTGAVHILAMIHGSRKWPESL